MTIHAYSQLYLSKASRTVGNMLHDAVYEFGIDGGAFLKRFIQSDVAKQFEHGNPKYIAGKSGLEVFLEVMEKTTGFEMVSEPVKSYDRSPEYWVGWMITHYEADIQKSYEVMDDHFKNGESKLKAIRKRCGITQETLANESGVSLNTIRAYERKSKDLNKAQFDIIMKLSKALKCEVYELLE